jgi:hypothetical protein
MALLGLLAPALAHPGEARLEVGLQGVHVGLVLGELRRGGIDVALDHGHGREAQYKPGAS